MLARVEQEPIFVNVFSIDIIMLKFLELIAPASYEFMQRKQFGSFFLFEQTIVSARTRTSSNATCTANQAQTRTDNRVATCTSTNRYLSVRVCARVANARCLCSTSARACGNGKRVLVLQESVLLAGSVTKRVFIFECVVLCNVFRFVTCHTRGKTSVDASV